MRCATAVFKVKDRNRKIWGKQADRITVLILFALFGSPRSSPHSRTTPVVRIRTGKGGSTIPITSQPQQQIVPGGFRIGRESQSPTRTISILFVRNTHQNTQRSKKTSSVYFPKAEKSRVSGRFRKVYSKWKCFAFVLTGCQQECVV